LRLFDVNGCPSFNVELSPSSSARAKIKNNHDIKVTCYLLMTVNQLVNLAANYKSTLSRRLKCYTLKKRLLKRIPLSGISEELSLR
jgi:hypothetical protein